MPADMVSELHEDERPWFSACVVLTLYATTQAMLPPQASSKISSINRTAVADCSLKTPGDKGSRLVMRKEPCRQE
jgi:hypothetical protein